MTWPPWFFLGFATAISRHEGRLSQGGPDDRAFSWVCLSPALTEPPYSS